VVYKDGSFLRIFEKWSIRDGALLGYSYHYVVPHEEVSIRYEMDLRAASASHPKYHLHISHLGDDIRLPTGKVRCEQVLEMIFEQFVMTE
jgi:hypothetical protein